MAVTVTRRRWLKSGGVLLVPLAAAVLGWGLMRQPRQTDREQIETLIATAEHGVEAMSVREMMSCLAPDYRDSAGLSRADLGRLIQAVAQNADKGEVTVVVRDLQVSAPKTTRHFDVQLVVSQGQESMPWQRQLEVHFAKQSLGWRSLWRERWVVTSVNGHGLDTDIIGALQ